MRVFVLLSSPCFRRGAIWSGNEAANYLLWMWQGWWRQTLLVLLAEMCVCVCASLQNSKYMSHVVTYRVLSHDLRLHSNRVLKVLAEKR